MSSQALNAKKEKEEVDDGTEDDIERQKQQAQNVLGLTAKADLKFNRLAPCLLSRIIETFLLMCSNGLPRMSLTKGIFYECTTMVSMDFYKAATPRLWKQPNVINKKMKELFLTCIFSMVCQNDITLSP
ncbi:hypothetical protein BCR42DRAFT_197983 [Absidia repens]|uniref:Uncharacterized protein n=1 Tax=Absidia repens TaxID=90262 RepID=A0A1X2HWW1_9FUNG|nr:hypothetical protein BCR42DRAFT_200104 [Absidia repens]ORZ04468.1 hypothetical protein BCR42DRAFT_197983 [Absidia repens]